MDQEQLMQAQMIEQEVTYLHDQFKLLDQNLQDLGEISESLSAIEQKETQDILVNIGKRIFLPVSITDKKFIVDVGRNNLVSKTIPEMRALLQEQTEKLHDGKNKIMERIHYLEGELEQFIKKINP